MVINYRTVIYNEVRASNPTFLKEGWDPHKQLLAWITNGKYSMIPAKNQHKKA